MAERQAMALALEVSRTPALARLLRRRPVPADVGVVLRVVSGCERTRAEQAEQWSTTESVIIDAATLYVRLVLLHGGADSYRVLGADREAPHPVLREHMRLLLKWLHPDRNGGSWDGAFSGRVLQAWNDVMTPERRAAYDARLSQAPGRGGGRPRSLIAGPTSSRTRAPAAKIPRRVRQGLGRWTFRRAMAVACLIGISLLALSYVELF